MILNPGTSEEKGMHTVIHQVHHGTFCSTLCCWVQEGREEQPQVPISTAVVVTDLVELAGILNQNVPKHVEAKLSAFTLQRRVARERCARYRVGGALFAKLKRSGFVG